MRTLVACTILALSLLSFTAKSENNLFGLFAKCDGVLTTAHIMGRLSEDVDSDVAQYIANALMTAAFQEDRNKNMHDYYAKKSEGRKQLEQSESEDTTLFLISICGTAAQDAMTMIEARQ